MSRFEASCADRHRLPSPCNRSLSSRLVSNQSGGRQINHASQFNADIQAHAGALHESGRPV